jgi:hypothetical protein
MRVLCESDLQWAPMRVSRQPKIGVLGRLQMFYDHVGQGLPVSRLEKIDHALMLSPHDLQQSGIADAVRANRVRFERRLLDHLDERHISANGVERVVEKQVLAENSSQFAFFRRFGVPILNFLKAINNKTVHGQRNQLRRATFDERPDNVELLHLLDAVVADRGPSVRLSYDDSHCLEIGKGLSYDVPLGCESLREFLLDDPFSRGQLPKRYFFFENGDNIGHLRGRGARSRECHSSPLTHQPQF